jgi:hypothetical protein
MRTKGKSGTFAVIEDGKIVIYNVDRDSRGYGVENVTRLPTILRGVSSGLDENLFPLMVSYEVGGYLLKYPRPEGGFRNFTISDQYMDRKNSESEKIIIDEADLSTEESSKRWYYIRQVLRDQGRLHLVWAGGRLPKKSKEMFYDWSVAVTNGLGESDSYDKIFEKYGDSLCNDFFTAVRGIKDSMFLASRNDVIILDRHGSKGYKPFAFYGELPEVDWKALPW